MVPARRGSRRLRPRPAGRLAAALVPLALVAPAGLSGCGDGKSEADVTALLDKAFTRPIRSADVSLDFELKVKGIKELKDPISLTVSGPYRGGGDRRIPSVDFDVSIRAGGQTFDVELVSTGDEAFVSFQGTAYKVPDAAVDRLNRQVAQRAAQDEKRSLSDFGVDAREWVEDAEDKGDAKVAGVATTHLSGELDVGRVLDDVNRLLERAGGTLGGQASPRLTEAQRKQIEQIVEDPTFDVFIGKGDDTIRRLSAELRLDIPEDERAGVGGAESGDISFSIEFANVGRAARIEAPASAKPLSELSERLGELGALGGLGGGAGSAGGAGGGPDTEQFEEYSECVKKADAGDLEALQKCSELLRRP